MKTKEPEVTLETYGLKTGMQVRFRHQVEQTWDLGKVIGIERDGSIGLIDDYNGGSRAIHAHLIQRQIKGPRGGKKWIPIID